MDSVMTADFFNCFFDTILGKNPSSQIRAGLGETSLILPRSGTLENFGLCSVQMRVFRTVECGKKRRFEICSRLDHLRCFECKESI
jgi:hypothetical protein